MEVKFSKEATDTLLDIVSLIEDKWNEKVADDFKIKVYRVVDSIEVYPHLFPLTQLEDIRKAVITKQTSLFYKVHKDHIEILFFWDNRQEPSL